MNYNSQSDKKITGDSVKKNRLNLFTILAPAATIFFLIWLVAYAVLYVAKTSESSVEEKEDRNYHVLIVGNYENEMFLEQVLKGAQKKGGLYNTKVELFVPHSYAQNQSLQTLLDYAAFSNADGIIAYIDSADETLAVPLRKDTNQIPLITIGQYSPKVPQISYIGNNYSELGRKTAEEALGILENQNNLSGTIFIVSNEYSFSSPNYLSNFMNSFQSVISKNAAIVVHNIDFIPTEFELIKRYPDCKNNRVVFIALNENDTIKTAQIVQNFAELKADLIGIGNNQVTQNLLNRGSITELISLNPEKIGEVAIKELFEYLNQRYSNNYISAELQITRRKTDE